MIRILKISPAYLATALCLAILILVIWFHRASFTTPFDYHYVRQFYDHSHWTVPSSQRKMGDGLLYQIAGYELVTEASFTEINPEAPPLGKYLMGISILVTGSATWANIPLFLALLFFTYQVAYKFFHDKDKVYRWLSVFLVAWQPLVWQQLPQTTLDLAQVTWLMGWLWSIIVLVEAKSKTSQYVATVGVGLFLGLFMSTKIALFLGPLLVFFGIWLWRKKKLLWFIASVCIAGGVYGLMYLPYLLSTDLHSALSLQKWILNYWLSSKSRAVPGITFVSLLSGWYLGHWERAEWVWLRVWNPTWLLGSVGPIYLAFKQRFKLEKLSTAHMAVAACLAALIVSLSIVPLFERYLLLIVPCLVLISVWVVSLVTKYRKNLFVALILWTALQTAWLLPPSRSEAIKEIERVASVPSYQELWAFVDPATQQSYSREQFWREAQTAHYQAQISKTEWKITIPQRTFSWQTVVPVTLDITHTTPLGKLHFQHPTELHRRYGRWYLVWEWSMVLPEWRPGYAITLEYEPQSSQLLNINGIVVAKDGSVPTVYVSPNRIKDELKMNSQILQLTNLSKPDQELLYKVSQLPDQMLMIAPVLPYVTPNSIADLDPGISISEAPGRELHREALKDQVVTKQVMGADKLKLSAPPEGFLLLTDPLNPDWRRMLQQNPKVKVPDVIMPAEILPEIKK